MTAHQSIRTISTEWQMHLEAGLKLILQAEIFYNQGFHSLSEC